MNPTDVSARLSGSHTCKGAQNWVMSKLDYRAKGVVASKVGSSCHSLLADQPNLTSLQVSGKVFDN